MAQFLKHEACPKCGSKDNLARYDDGSGYCFGCQYTENRKFYAPTISGPEKRVIELPADATTQLDARALEWLGKYGIKQEECVRLRMLWSDSTEQLIFPLYKPGNDLQAWQGRNFAVKAKSKYISHGKIHEILYPLGRPGDNLILTEDLLSAVKIARQGSAMPLWGSEASTHLLMRLKGITNNITIWLDSDKWKNAHDIVKRAQSIGMTACCVFTTLDPKEYNDAQIKFFLNN